MKLTNLFFIFMKIGAVLLGGGYVILPVMLNEFSEKRKLLTKDEIIEYFTLSQALPGIIAVNMSIFIGYRLIGRLGAVIAMIGITFIPFWCIILLASILGTLLDNTLITGALRGVGIAVIVLLLLTIREIWQKSDKNVFFYLIFISATISLLVFKLSPIQVILIFSALGIIINKIREKCP